MGGTHARLIPLQRPGGVGSHIAGVGHRAPARPQPRNLAEKGISAAERFNYLYSDQELQEIAGPVGELGQRTGGVLVLFNNCYRDNAQRNALQLRSLLEN